MFRICKRCKSQVEDDNIELTCRRCQKIEERIYNQTKYYDYSGAITVLVLFVLLGIIMFTTQ